MDALIKALPKVLQNVGTAPELVEPAAIAAWKHTAGEGLRQHAIATKLEEKTLVVLVRDAIWQQQLTTMKRQLIHRVNSVLGQSLVSSIELRIDPKAFPEIASVEHKSDELRDNEVPLELWSAASTIQDKQLRQKFLKAALGVLRRKEAPMPDTL